MQLEFETVRDMISERLDAEKTQSTEIEDFIQMIADRVAELMESNMELFLNHLYRMDVDEKKVNRMLLRTEESEDSVYMAFARLIFERQKERLESRKKYKQQSSDFWSED